MNEPIKITRDQRNYKVPLGRRGENKATIQPFDISYFVEEFGEGRAELVHKLPYANTYYPVPIERDGNIVTWTILACDTMKQGSGDAEIRWFVPNEDGDDVLAISATMKTIILSSMSGDEGEAPDGLESWINEITRKVAEAIAKLDDGTKIKEVIDEVFADNPFEYASEEDVNTFKILIINALKDVYTKDESDRKFLTEHQSLAGYAKKTDIPDISGKADKSEIPEPYNDAPIKKDIGDIQKEISRQSESIENILTRLKSGKEEDSELHLGFYLDENGDLCQKEVE